MKNLKFFAILALCCFALTACHKSIDSKIDDYEKALKKGDVEKALQIADDLDEEDLSFAQKSRLFKISLENAGVIYKAALEESGEEIKDALEEADEELGENYEELSKELNDAAEKVLKELDEAKDEIDDELDDLDL